MSRDNYLDFFANPVAISHSTGKIDNQANTLLAVVIGLYGFAAGFGIWLFYRLVRFAIKG